MLKRQQKVSIKLSKYVKAIKNLASYKRSPHVSLKLSTKLHLKTHENVSLRSWRYCNRTRNKVLTSKRPRGEWGEGLRHTASYAGYENVGVVSSLTCHQAFFFEREREKNNALLPRV